MNLENKTKPYDIELKDYIPVYGWFRYQIKGFEAGRNIMHNAIQERKPSIYFEAFGNWSLRTAWLSLYNVGCVYSFILWDNVLNLGIVDKIQKLVGGE